MSWTVLYHDAFLPELEELDEGVRDELQALVEVLTLTGPLLGRPYADTLAGSRYANMKELRFMANNSPWRAAFAFDPHRRAMILVAASKSGIAQRLFYKTLITKADARFAEHLRTLKDD